MPSRFVILFHETPPESDRSNHFDLMFERDGALSTWAVDDLTLEECERLATRLPDHRLEYLSYEGPISDNRGRVSQHDTGMCDIRCFDDTRVTIDVRGQQLRGQFRFTHKSEQDWTAHFMPDTW